MVNGIQPCYSGVAYARFGRKGCTQQWYTTLLFRGGVYPWVFRRTWSGWYTTLLFRGGVYPAVTEMTTRLWYTTLLFRGGVYPAQVFSSPKVLVATSHITNQPTEYSCFHDDQASPQALIPAIPSVLVFLAERVGVEPTDAFTSPVFKAGAFDHSAISPFF